MNKSKRRDKINKRKLRTTIIVIIIVAVIIAAAVFVLRSRVSSKFGGESELPESAQVTLGSISTTITGSGTLENEGSENVDIPETIETEEIVVKVGDKVEEGDLLATVNTASVISAMSDLQEEMEALDEQLEDAAEDAVSTKISSQVSGRVKEIYAAEGDDVASVMYENNALMLISLDGYMAVDIESDVLKKGDTVTAVLSDGTEYAGVVDELRDETATVLITDNGPVNGETVTVNSADGDSVGSGELYIHNPLKVTGYAGTISNIHTEENKTVKQGAKLFTLTDTSYTANYDAIIREREELEEDMHRLITIYKEGAVYAPFAGTVESITDPEEEEDNSEEVYAQITLCPSKTMSVTTSIDESEILSLEIGQEAIVTINSIGDTEFIGTVSEIETAGTSSGGVTRYTAIVTVDKTEQMLSGMSASVSITTEGVDNALLIPEDALNKTRNTAYVYTSYNEETEELGGMVEITYGISNGTYLQVLSGLSEGDTVYYYEDEDRMSGSIFGMSGGMFDMSGGMPNMGGGMPNMGGGMPNMGGGMPDMGGRR